MISGKNFNLTDPLKVYIDDKPLQCTFYSDPSTKKFSTTVVAPLGWLGSSNKIKIHNASTSAQVPSHAARQIKRNKSRNSDLVHKRPHLDRLLCCGWSWSHRYDADPVTAGLVKDATLCVGTLGLGIAVAHALLGEAVARNSQRG